MRYLTLSVVVGVSAHLDWPLGKLSGLEKWHDSVRSEPSASASAQVCPHESPQQRRLDIGAGALLWADQLLQVETTFYVCVGIYI